MTISTYQETVDQWISNVGVRYFNELTNMTLLTEEVGELARIIARQYGEQSWKADEKPGVIKDAIADEMCDVIFVVTCLANQMDIDLQAALRRNLQKKTDRDSSRHKTNEKLSES